MTDEKRRRSLRAGAALAAALAAGYLGGRHHVFGHLRDLVLEEPASPAPDPPDSIPPGPPTLTAETPTYGDIHDVLQARLRQQHGQSARWIEILQAEPLERDRLVGELRAELTGMFRPLDRGDGVPAATASPWVSTDSVSVQVVELEALPGIRLLCALFIPLRAPGPRPALLALHGSDGNLQRMVADLDYHHGLGMDLARRGLIVLAPFQVSGDSRAAGTLYVKALAAGWSLEAIELAQLLRAVDYLRTVDGVDTTHVGVYGISLGGMHALRLGALDERLSVVVTSGFLTDRFAWLYEPVLHSQEEGPRDLTSRIRRFVDPVEYLRVILPSMGILLDDMNLVSLIQPRFLGVESGSRTPRHEGAVAEFEKVARLYAAVGHPERAAFLGFDGVHETSIETVFPFLERWIATDF